jgi:hemoglobin
MKHEDISEESLRHLVELFYERVRSDPLIGPVFENAIDDWPEHLDTLAAFWSSVMLTSGRYKGRPLPAHLKHSHEIDSRSFARWLAIWNDATNHVFAPASAAALQQKAARIAQSLSLGIELAKVPLAARKSPSNASASNGSAPPFRASADLRTTSGLCGKGKAPA